MQVENEMKYMRQHEVSRTYMTTTWRLANGHPSGHSRQKPIRLLTSHKLLLTSISSHRASHQRTQGQQRVRRCMRAMDGVEECGRCAGRKDDLRAGEAGEAGQAVDEGGEVAAHWLAGVCWRSRDILRERNRAIARVVDSVWPPGHRRVVDEGRAEDAAEGRAGAGCRAGMGRRRR